MNIRLTSARALLLALAVSMGMSPFAQNGSTGTASQDRNADGPLDVVGQNFHHHHSGPAFTASVTSEPEDSLNEAPQPFLLPRAVSVGDQPVEDRAPVTLDSSSESRSAASPSGRAPPSTR
jgi:hypothetical protein